MPNRRDRFVLVVEDDPRVRELAVELFHDLDFAVYDVYSGIEALRLLRERAHIRCVFADVRMPGMSGTELAREITRRRPDVKVVLTSGYVDREQVADFPFVPKPWRREEGAAAFAQ